MLIRGERVELVSDGLKREFTENGLGSVAAGALWWTALRLDEPEAAREWRGQVTSGKAAAYYARAGGATHWLRLRAQGASGPKRSTWLLAVEDVTEEREEHERARLEAEHFHALIQRSSEGISLFDKTSKILYESPSNKRIHGYDPEEMEGRTLMSFCHPDDTARIALRFKHLAEAPGVVETEIVRFRHKQGHYIYLEGTVLNATDDPRLGAMVNNFREVTGRLEAERELRRAKSAAENAQRMQQHFLTNLSHEFKTPLTLIRGPLESLRGGPVSEARTARTLDLVFRNIDRLDALLNELVDLARLEAGVFALRVRRHDLCTFVREQARAFEGLSREREIELRLVEVPAVCEAFFDAPKLSKVLVNLLGNAFKFSPPRTTIRVAVNVRPGRDGDGVVEVAVIDQGPGMDAETAARVFERFYQGDAGLARGHGGMGIGMAIAREMVEMHGGQLTVASEPGLGSTFTCTLPLGCEHLDPDDIDTTETPEARPHSIGPGPSFPPTLLSMEDPEESTGPRPRLLLVEDNLDMRAYLRMHLDQYYTVREAENGEVALAVLREAVPDIILSDVMMPRLNGLDLCRRLKEDRALADIPVLLLSAKGGADHRLEGLRAGACDYLEKPFSVPEVLHKLRTRLPEPARRLLDGETMDPVWAGELDRCIGEHLSLPTFNVDELARGMGYSSRQLRRRVIEHYRMTPAALLLDRRLKKARDLIDQKRFETVAQVAYAVGLSPGYFSRRYRHAYRVDTIRL
ncbi:MAG: ATP-binding protein [Verrucomicrobiota bacterium]